MRFRPEGAEPFDSPGSKGFLGLPLPPVGFTTMANDIPSPWGVRRGDGLRLAGSSILTKLKAPPRCASPDVVVRWLGATGNGKSNGRHEGDSGRF
jgi:hypothetical protein